MVQPVSCPVLELVYALAMFLQVSVDMQILGKDDDALVKRVVEALPRLPPTKVARDGSIMEWVCEALKFHSLGLPITYFSHSP